MVMLVPDLKECCQLCIIHHTIGDGYTNKRYEQQQHFLLHQLDEGAWGAESLAILVRLVKHHRYFLPPKVILALLADTSKELCLKECPALTEDCLNTVLYRCRQLLALDLTENPLLQLSEVDLFGANNFHSLLTSVTLEDCSQVKDAIIQTLLRNAPALQHLNIARCDVTDCVFLLDEQSQLAREASLEIQDLSPMFESHLQSVDVSRCDEFTSTGVRHLCTLCGPTLQSVNLAWTKVDCTAFLYLSGLGLPSAVEFFMASGTVSSDVMEPLVYNLHQFDIICHDLAAKFGHDEEDDVKADKVDNQSLVDIEDIQAQFVSQDSTHARGCRISAGNLATSDHNDESGEALDYSSPEVPPSDRILGKSSPTFQVICLDDVSDSKFSCHGGDMCNKLLDRNHLGAVSDDFSSQVLSRAEACSDENPRSGKVYKSDDALTGTLSSKLYNMSDCDIDKNEDETSSGDSRLAISNAKCVEDENEQSLPVGIRPETDFVSAANGNKEHVTHRNNGPATAIDEDEQKMRQADFVSSNVTSESGENMKYKNGSRKQNRANNENKYFFQSNISSICLTATVFREEVLGLRCFQKFLRTNKDLHSISIYSGIRGNFLSDNVLDLIGTYARDLECLCVEGSDKLTHVGISEIARKCKKLFSLDLTGVSFVGDESIIPLVDGLPLTHVKLAETRISGSCLNYMAELPKTQKLQEVDLSWCEEIENNSALNNFVSVCPVLERLMLRECCVSAATMTCIAQHSHRITELSLASNMSVMRDEHVILLSENLPLLESIDLGWNSYLTNPSIEALLSNCHCLSQANLEGLKLITSTPFLPLISVPEEICVYLEETRQNSCPNDPKGDCWFRLSDLPCLPHRSSTYSTHLRHVNLTYSDFVEDLRIEQIVTVTHGGIEMLDYYGNKVEPSKRALESYLREYMEERGQL